MIPKGLDFQARLYCKLKFSKMRVSPTIPGTNATKKRGGNNYIQPRKACKGDARHYCKFVTTCEKVEAQNCKVCGKLHDKFYSEVSGYDKCFKFS